MLLRRLKYRCTVWVALLTLVLVTVLPTAAQALVVVQGNTDWLEVCSVSGMVWVHADTGEVRNQQPDGSTTTGEANPSCPWCTLHGGAADLPVGWIVVDLPPRLTDLPPAFYRAPPICHCLGASPVACASLPPLIPLRDAPLGRVLCFSI